MGEEAFITICALALKKVDRKKFDGLDYVVNFVRTYPKAMMYTLDSFYAQQKWEKDVNKPWNDTHNE